MKFKEIDEQAAMEYFDMLKDAPSIKEILETYPGVDNLMHVMTAQLATHFILPWVEGKMEVENLVEKQFRWRLLF